METCDALIVGGGPAGSSCAWKLRQQGLDVMVLDKATSNNPYDAALAQLKEKLDADKDKFSNIAEIKAGTLPGDPKSKPAGKPHK